MTLLPSELRGHALEFGACTVFVSIDPILTVLECESLDAVVSSDDSRLSMSGGVSHALRMLAGEAYFEEARPLAPVPVGDIVVTGPGRIRVRHVLHAVTVDWDHDVRPTERTIRQLGRELFVRCEGLGIRSLAIPAIAAGAADFPPYISARIVARALVDHLQNRSILERVVFSLPDAEAYFHFVRELFALAGREPPEWQGLVEAGHSVVGSRQALDAAGVDVGPAAPARLPEPDTTSVSPAREAARGPAAPSASASRSWWPFRLRRSSRKPTAPMVREIPTRVLVPADAGPTRGALSESALRPVLTRRYVLLEELGRGGFSVVYLAWDLVLRRIVAIKRMRPDATDPALLQHEAAVAMDLSHEGIVRLYHFEPRAEDDAPFLVMEYVPWSTGEKWVADAGRAGLAPRVVLEVGLRTCDALAYAHDRDVLHLDIKPGNVFVDPAADRTKLADFGLSRVASRGHRTLQAIPAGTPAYMAPEQAESSARLTPAADVYQLVATLWDLLTGEAPQATRVLEQTRVGPLAPVLGRLACALATDPAARPQSARELAPVLEGALACC